MPSTARPKQLINNKSSERPEHVAWFMKHIQELIQWTEHCVGVSPGHGGDAHDVVQTVAYELVRPPLNGKPERVLTENEFISEMRTRLRHRAIDLVRKRTLQGFSLCPGTSSSGVSHGQFGLHLATHSTPSLQCMRNERENFILTKSCHDMCNSPKQLVTGIVIVLLRQIDNIPLKAIACSMGKSAVEVAKQYYRTIKPLRAGLDKLAIGNWPSYQDTPQESLHRALIELPLLDRVIVELCHLEDQEYAAYNPETGKHNPIKCRYMASEVGTLLNMDPSDVAMRAFLARKVMRKIIN